MKKKVFISHSSKDKQIADLIVQTLEDNDISCWIAPRDILPGTEYGQALVEAIEDSGILLLILSSHSNASPQVLREVERAASKRVPIVPFLIEETTLSKSMEYFVASHHWLDATTPPLEDHFPKLIEAIKTHLSQDSTDIKTEPESPRPASSKVKPEKKKGHRSLLAGLTAAAVCIIAVGILYYLLIGSGTGNQAIFAEGIAHIHAGRLAEAEEIFISMKDDPPLYYQGMSALYLARGDAVKLDQTVSKAEAEGVKALYFDIVKAHLALRRGDLSRASQEYNRALQNESLKSWQKAECYYGLGRIYRARNQGPEALKQFEQASFLDTNYVSAYSAQGLVLEELGRDEDAAISYKKAVSINTKDSISSALYQKLKRKADLEQTSERRKRRNTLVNELAEAYRTRKPRDRIEDEWSSKPLYYFLTDISQKGELPVTEGEDEFLVERFAQELAAGPRLHQVERELIDSLLAELKLSSSNLTDPKTAIRLGKVLSARLMITGSVLRYKGQIQIILRAVDTETTKIVGTATLISNSFDALLSELSAFVVQLSTRIDNSYPIRGVIISVEGGVVRLDIGRLIGVTEGMKFKIKETDGREVEFQVEQVNDESSTASLTPASGDIAFKTGWRVEAITP